MARLLRIDLYYEAGITLDLERINVRVPVSRLVLEQTQSGGAWLDVWPLLTDNRDPEEPASEGASLYNFGESTLWVLKVTYALPDTNRPPVTWTAFAGFSIDARSIVRDERGRIRRFRLLDWLAATRRAAVYYDYTRTDVSSRGVLGKLLVELDNGPGFNPRPDAREWWGRPESYAVFGGAVTTPNVEIPKIDIPRGDDFWAALSPYFDPWGPLAQFVVVRDTGKRHRDFLQIQASFNVIDITEVLRAANGPSGLGGSTIASLGDLDVYRADFVETQNERVDQVRISYRPPYLGGEQADGVDFDERLESDPLYTAGDGTTVESGRIWHDLHEDEENPTLVTRTVLAGLFQRSYAPPVGAVDGPTGVPLVGERIASTETRYTYAGDYQRIVRAETTTGALVDLPGVGRVYRPDVERAREDTEWIDDPLDPGAFIKLRVTKLRSGLVIAVNDANGNPVLGSAVPALRATESNAVDTSATSSQRWLSAPYLLTVERYEPKGTDEMLVLATDTDLLLGIALPARPAETTARASIRGTTREIVEWRPPARPDSPAAYAPAAHLDATAIGLENARDLGDRMLLIGGFFKNGRLASSVTGTIAPMWFDPSRFQIAKVVRWEGQKYANSYAVVGARYEFAVTADEINVESLVDLWTPFGDEEES